MKLKIGSKELIIKFAFEPTLKGHLVSKLAKVEKEITTGEENMSKVEDMMLNLLPEMFLIGLQRYHREEFGYNYDNNEGREEQLGKVYSLIDEYFDEENSDLMVLYNGLQEEMLQNSFLSSLFDREKAKVSGKNANEASTEN